MTNISGISSARGRTAVHLAANRRSGSHMPALAATHSHSNKAKSKAQHKVRPQITVSLDGVQDGKIATYSTLDRINGKVSIVCPVDTTVDGLDISFVGMVNTYIERLGTASASTNRAEASHQFLKLIQPIAASAWPADKMFLADQTYDFDFVFAVPEQLLPRVCRHGVASANILHEHLQLPPSLGDDTVHDSGFTDDFAPDMIKISYAVTINLKAESLPEQSVFSARKVRVIPIFDERAPLVDGPGSDYQLRAEKDIRKGVFMGKLGRLVLEAVQPRAISLPYHAAQDTEPASTHATVHLRFDPVERNTQPPKLGSLVTKLKINSFYACTARPRIPTKKDMRWDLNQGVQSETMSLSTRCMAAVDWKFHPDSDQSSHCSRRDSSCSSTYSDIVEPSEKYCGKGYYTASIVVPVTLPAKKAWVPTFHGCLVSRVYGISLHLSVGPTSTIDIRMPLQITSQGNPQSAARHRASLTTEELAFEAASANAFFAPRIVQVSNRDFAGVDADVNGSVSVSPGELPPGYDEFPREGTRTPVRV